MITLLPWFPRLSTAVVMIPVICLLALILAFPGGISAKPTTSDQARIVVKNWLAMNASPLDTPLGQQIKDVEAYYHEEIAYYIVYLSPKGLVIVSGDDMVEPIVGFLPTGVKYDPSHDNPLGALVSRDLPGRVLVAREVDRQVQSKKRQLTSSDTYTVAQRKWALLLSASATRAKAGVKGSEEDSSPALWVWVPPMVQSTWDQSVTWDNGQACYNWYTPGCNPADINCPDPFVFVGDPNNYPSGCVGTAMAQLMRFFQYPTGSVVTGPYGIYIDDPNTPVPYNLRGGDGSGGPYNWGNMPLDPNAATTDNQRKAIGALTMDVGASLNTWYTSGGSYADTCNISSALVDSFGYGNAVNTWWFQASDPNSPPEPIQIPESTRNNMINPNLDAGYPAILGIRSDDGVGHAVVCDGYGDDQGTSYHHLNMGWSGYCDAWYNLPTVDPNSPPTPAFTVLNKVIYNVYTDPNSSGEIFSGRVTDKSGIPIGGVTITATGPGDPLVAVTNEMGTYAFPMVDPNTTFSVSASKRGYNFSPNPWPVTTGTSTSTNFWDDFGDTGNVWLGSSVVGSKNIPIPAIIMLLKTDK